jgi:prepilin-type N-terminal cleavage/methylation domain-containing protein
MCQLPTRRRTQEPGGFTLVEVLVSISVLAIGMMSAALLMSITYKNSVRSRYVAEAAQLASEKLEDLNRYPASITSGFTYPDPHIFVPSGSTTCGFASVICVGSIAPALVCSGGTCTTNPPATPLVITAGEIGAGGTFASAADTVNYSDAVYISAANGSLQETYQTAAGTTPQYATLTFSPTGVTPVISTNTTAPTVGETFDRRWTIEQDQPVAGVRRVTVLVTLLDLTVQPPVTFQMSVVRP